MTRKEYVAFAAIINAQLQLSVTVSEKYRVEQIANDMVKLFARDNQRFDAKRFLAACGLGAPVSEAERPRTCYVRN